MNCLGRVLEEVLFSVSSNLKYNGTQVKSKVTNSLQLKVLLYAN